MPVYVLRGFQPSAIMVSGGGPLGLGANAMLDPGYAAATDALTFTITDGDTFFSGNQGGPDADQTAIVTLASGATVANGLVQLGNAFALSNGTTNVILYEVFVGGTLTGYVANSDLQPGISWTVAAVTGTTQSGVTYTSIASTTHDPGANTNFFGGSGNDSIRAGAGNDSVVASGGNDSIDGGAGDDFLDGGAGNDRLIGGAGNDILSGGGGNDLLWGGEGDDRFVIGPADGADTIVGGAGFDSLDNTSGTSNTTLTFSTSTGWTMVNASGLSTLSEIERAALGAGNDTVSWGALSTGFDLDAGAGNDSVIAGAGNDLMSGGAGSDLLTGGAGNDLLFGGTGNDTLLGGAGDDTIRGGPGNDSMVGGAGIDLLDYSDATAGVSVNLTTGSPAPTGGALGDSISGFEDVLGSAQGDTLTGSSDANRLWGGAGNDTLNGGANNDTLWGGEGGDTLTGGTGDDLVFGGVGADSIRADAGNDTIHGDDGDDTIFGSDGSDVVFGGDGADVINTRPTIGTPDIGYPGFYAADATPLDDRDTVYGGDGADFVLTGDDADLLYGGLGADTLDAGFDADTVFGEDGDDLIGGHEGSDLIYGGEGNDVIYGGTIPPEADVLPVPDDTDLAPTNNRDTIYGGIGNDTVFGGDDGDAIFGDEGDDSLDGGIDDDTLLGGAGNDALIGGEGDDWLSGGPGNDTLSGGAGSDVFVLPDGGGADSIVDFERAPIGSGLAATDRLDVSALTDAMGFPVDWADVIVSDDGSGNAVLTFPSGKSVVLVGVPPARVTGIHNLARIGIPCFGTGTRILTERGEVPVEAIRAGDRVVTLDHGLQRVVWAGGRHLDTAALEAEPLLRPVLIRDGAMGNRGDVLVSPNHALLAEVDGQEMLVRAKHLAEMGDARFRIAKGRKEVGYHHLLLERHGIVFAQGMATETMYPGPMAVAALGPAVAAEIAAAFPLLAPVLAGIVEAEVLYGPTARPVARRKMIFQAPGAAWRAAA